jgi:hypothetical protein
VKRNDSRITSSPSNVKERMRMNDSVRKKDAMYEIACMVMTFVF